jgi:hypothetical protein
VSDNRHCGKKATEKTRNAGVEAADVLERQIGDDDVRRDTLKTIDGLFDPRQMVGAAYP